MAMGALYVPACCFIIQTPRMYKMEINRGKDWNTSGLEITT